MADLFNSKFILTAVIGVPFCYFIFTWVYLKFKFYKQKKLLKHNVKNKTFNMIELADLLSKTFKDRSMNCWQIITVNKNGKKILHIKSIPSKYLLTFEEGYYKKWGLKFRKKTATIIHSSSKTTEVKLSNFELLELNILLEESPPGKDFFLQYDIDGNTLINCPIYYTGF